MTHEQETQLQLKTKKTGRLTYRALSQCWNHIPEWRQRLVDHLGFIQHCTLRSSFTHLGKSNITSHQNELHEKIQVHITWMTRRKTFLLFHSQPDPQGRVCWWVSAPSVCALAWCWFGRCCDSSNCARSCLRWYFVVMFIMWGYQPLIDPFRSVYDMKTLNNDIAQKWQLPTEMMTALNFAHFSSPGV